MTDHSVCIRKKKVKYSVATERLFKKNIIYTASKIMPFKKKKKASTSFIEVVLILVLVLK